MYLLTEALLILCKIMISLRLDEDFLLWISGNTSSFPYDSTSQYAGFWNEI